ncbi:hypothetical protein GON01_05680 [Sphingomonas sp. MAH-20]|uniref:Uncharacterized protein n=1 Tax=Sphingomonas horti TaxID=2682842 RepID=A0A6I4IYY0_9SPHN|nr:MULTISPECIES: hypothetical protein [Sphingomonas]MBA2918462.1 hypothetical protein [Sphingomonas sp. CGMCC 1.13658]MVO77429.1 hypothetical protein [Sphingomonas horti]
MSESIKPALPLSKRADTASGRVVITPGEQHPYKVVFKMGERTLSEHPVPTVREGEVMIRHQLAHIQFAAQEERPDPKAPKRKRISPVV